MGVKNNTVRSVPRVFSRAKGVVGVLDETDIKLTKGSRLRVKVVLFDTLANFRKSWRAVDKYTVMRYGYAAVYRPMWGLTHSVTGHRRMEADERYFAVVGLCVRHLTMEIISHEAVHVGYAYHKRVARSPFASVDEFDEERIAYPAGRAAAAMNRWLHDGGWYA